MKIQDLLEDDSWLDIAKDKLSSIGNFIAHGPEDAMNDYRAFIKKNIRRYGSQKTPFTSCGKLHALADISFLTCCKYAYKVAVIGVIAQVK